MENVIVFLICTGNWNLESGIGIRVSIWVMMTKSGWWGHYFCEIWLRVLSRLQIQTR